MEDELLIVKKICSGYVPETELIDIYHTYHKNYRILFWLAQHPQFPERFSIDLIPKFYSMDLIRMMKNKRVRPMVQKQAEIEFIMRFQRMPLGEKISYMKIVPYTLLIHLTDVDEKKVVEAILKNNQCTEDIIIRFITKKTSKQHFYEILIETEWYKRPAVIKAILIDPEAPIRIILEILSLLNRNQLREIYQREDAHKVVKDRVKELLEKTFFP